MPNLGPTELLIILGILVLLFGASRLPKLGKSMGQSIRGFKKGLNEDGEDKELEGSDAARLDKGDKAGDDKS
ncbi:MAG: twin-arginine translocase TatA/TatE family subunit [Actinomycetota bacterium]|nr:MAG: twin-arginine translocase TatA/TatE family subunit [Actinomycetota bacterium]